MGKQFLMFCTALIVSLTVTPFVKKFAVKVGAMDVPKDNRRVHKVPIPLIGGLAIYLAFTVVVLIFMPKPFSRTITGLLLGGTVITAAGLIDDLRPLSPKMKLLLQIIASGVLVYFGVTVKFVTNPFDRVTGMSDIGFLSIPATVFWIVGVTNAFNLIDGLDGLAAGVAAISCITLFIVSVLNNRMTAAMLTAALAGSSIGFIPYNFNPAKIFMGDTGAQFLGFMLAAISIEGAIKSAAAIVITVPILALGLPIYDTLIAIVRRCINKKPVMQGDKGHLHHRLLDMGLSQKQAVTVMYIISALLGITAIFATELTTVQSFIILIAVLCIVFIFSKKAGMLKKKER
ncbi:MAG: MraY family glycosyltransferase [Clostridiales bacterium]|nr:MraY family glycosyltransferase [Clostridiales bacterium]